MGQPKQDLGISSFPACRNELDVKMQAYLLVEEIGLIRKLKNFKYYSNLFVEDYNTY